MYNSASRLSLLPAMEMDGMSNFHMVAFKMFKVQEYYSSISHVQMFNDGGLSNANMFHLYGLFKCFTIQTHEDGYGGDVFS